MNIETKWLEDFLSLAHTQSFSKSAEERFLTQPAFSRRIKALEAAVGRELIDRTRFPVQLTDEGTLFRITAKNLVSQLNESIAHLCALKKSATPVLNVAVSHTLSLSLFPSFAQSIKADLEHVQIRQLVANVDDSVHALKNGLCDFLVAFDDFSLSNGLFSRLELQTESLVPVCYQDEEGEPIYSLDAKTQEDIPYLAYPEGIYLGRRVKSLLDDPPRKLNLRQLFESPMADSLKVMALQRMGVAWVPTFSVTEELKQGFLSICGDASWQLPLTVCVYRCNRLLSPEAERLWGILQRRYDVVDSSLEKT
ncbi:MULTISPECIES: LysR substrate-binding domain-containing protein [Marinomonas]|uniref:LysR substrate-binding domain-containing protein n=1 Tax=Marinomonas arenicola TaxID=569601 RepID=A0ABU9G0V5_9GAMM|nr:LysR substrate-binding domain-containing protein [Marinomonas sp. KMM3893]